MTRKKQTKPPSYAAVLQNLKEGFRNTDAKNVIELLEQQARDAVIEVLSGYLATPDALRELVREEFKRSISYEYVSPGHRSSFETHPLPKAALEKAKTLAEEHMATPEFQAQQLERVKNVYVRTFSERMEQYAKDHAWRDAHEAYQRAFKAPVERKRTKPDGT